MGLTLGWVAVSAGPADPGLLFYVSGEQGAVAEVASSGTSTPAFEHDITKIAAGFRGAALQCGDVQLLAWRAPGNIYAQRGTLSFFWRARYPTGPTEFPIFRVAYADHSSWDMVWLRIDYNGHGFDAFVTDASLARTRVSVTLQPFPPPHEWTHLALSWDETIGIRFYVNGRLAAKQDAVAVYDTGLDQFGPHSRVISPHNVLSESNFIRGGDLDELRIYDRMLGDETIATLARGEAAIVPVRNALDPASAASRAEWWLRHGWSRPGEPPPYYAGPTVSVRKVEIHDAYDLKRWWWKACDGIRETTWPGVYNRSRLPGRQDYFQLPDWDCYVESGRAITFSLPEERWNHVEIAGAAWGRMELLPVGVPLETASESIPEALLFTRRRGQERTIHTLREPIIGRQIRFTNEEAEQPIGEFSAAYVTAGTAPSGSRALGFRLEPEIPDHRSLDSIVDFIQGRYPPEERGLLVAQPESAGAALAAPVSSEGTRRRTAEPSDARPLTHVLVPNTWDGFDDGLDGIEIDLPALVVQSTHGEFFPVRIQVKDPLWPMRSMFDFSFSIKPGERKTLWLDLRDRLLPPGKGLLLTFAGAGPGFGASALQGAKMRLLFKPRDLARREHEQDRFTQAKDSFAMLVEEWPTSPKLNLWVRFESDLKDLLRANPEHVLGRQYAAVSALAAPRPRYEAPGPPPGVPRWAFLQTELLGRVKRFVTWYIDHRQVVYGDFGGGISDDTDLTNLWPGIALMGCEPEKIQRSLGALLEAAHRNGMLTNGLPTGQSDELHSYEEGINCLGQNMLLRFGSPRLMERAMETARGLERITGINAAGHRHIRSTYYSGTKMALEEPWGTSKPDSFLVLHPAQLLVDYNGSPAPRKLILELADGMLAHRRVDHDGHPSLAAVVRFRDDRELEWRAVRTPVPPLPSAVYWGAWKWTGERRYLDPLFDRGLPALLEVNANALDLLGLREARREEVFARSTPKDEPYRWVAGARVAIPREEITRWQLDRDKTRLEKVYAAHLESCDLVEYINTHGSLWSDRVGVPTAELQRTRLGGIALLRGAVYPGHLVSWDFAAPANDQSLAILIPHATPREFKVIAFNLERTPVRSTMTGWNIDPGQWEITQGADRDGDDAADGEIATHEARFERSRSLEFVFPPRATTILTLRLKTAGAPYWSRPDLGIDPEDVTVRPGAVHVRVHSLGSVGSPAATLALRDNQGRVLAKALIPALAAPNDLQPKTEEIILRLPTGAPPHEGFVEIDPDEQLEEITRRNNRIRLSGR
ncbi:MAG: LamG domain-containing protein [Opitutus sp.]|nr:LamG domain-containing protein [Opitutus sp.]